MDEATNILLELVKFLSVVAFDFVKFIPPTGIWSHDV